MELFWTSEMNIEVFLMETTSRVGRVIGNAQTGYEIRALTAQRTREQTNDLFLLDIPSSRTTQSLHPG